MECASTKDVVRWINSSLFPRPPPYTTTKGVSPIADDCYSKHVRLNSPLPSMVNRRNTLPLYAAFAVVAFRAQDVVIALPITSRCIVTCDASLHATDVAWCI